MNQANAIQAIVERRNIRWLVHFTHINNLLSILEKGLIPRAQLEPKFESTEESIEYLLGGGGGQHTDYILPDNSRVDGKTDRNCLSIMFPNNKMLWHKRKQYPDEQWVFLFLKTDILWEKPCLFYPINAADNKVRFQNKSLFSTAEALENVFAGERQGLKDYLPTDVQAEMMVQGVIEPSYIMACYLHQSQQSDWEGKLVSNYPNIDFRFDNIHRALMDFRENFNWSKI